MRRLAILVVVLAAAILGVAVWQIAGRASSRPEWSSGRDASAAIASWASSAEDSAVLDLRSVVPLPWDYFVVFAPYTSRAQIDQALGFQWAGAAQSSIDTLDCVALVVFVRGGEVVSAFEHPRDKGDFAAGRIRASVHLTGPSIQIVHRADGWRVLEVPAVAQDK